MIMIVMDWSHKRSNRQFMYVFTQSIRSTQQNYLITVITLTNPLLSWAGWCLKSRRHLLYTHRETYTNTHTHSLAHTHTHTHTHTQTHTHTRSVDSLSFTAALSRLHTLVIYYEVIKVTSCNSCARALCTFISLSYSLCLSSLSYTHRFSPRFCEKNRQFFKWILLIVPKFYYYLDGFVFFCFSLLFFISLSFFQKFFQSQMARGGAVFFSPRMARGERECTRFRLWVFEGLCVSVGMCGCSCVSLPYQEYT